MLAAESAGFHAVTFRDSPEAGRLNALQRAAFAGPLTRSIALIPEVDTAYTEPFHVSTQLASLDYVTGGRAGWIATADDESARRQPPSDAATSQVQALPGRPPPPSR